MKRTLLGMLAAAAAAATLSASGFAITAAAQSDQQPTRAELVQRWAEAALDAQVKGMKTSLRLNAGRKSFGARLNPRSGRALRRGCSPCKRSRAVTCRRWTA